MLAAFVLAALAALAIPEPVKPDGRWRQSLRPRIGIPPHLRVAFAAGLPCMVATWALGGLILAIGPSLQASVFGQSSHLAGGLPIFLLAGISSVASLLVRDLSPRTTAIGGLSALLVGVGVALVALVAESGLLFLLASAICGLGFGPGFAGIFRALADQAPEHRRAELVSSVLAVAYLAFSIPALVGGFGITQIGLQETALIYGIALMAVAAVALALTGRVEVRQDLPAEA